MELEKNVEIKWTERIKNDVVFQRAKEKMLLLRILKNRRHSWIGHTIRHNEFVVNILEGAISRKKAVGRPWLQYLKQVARNTAADSYTAMKRMACNNSRWKVASQSKDWKIRRRGSNLKVEAEFFSKTLATVSQTTGITFKEILILKLKEILSLKCI